MASSPSSSAGPAVGPGPLAAFVIAVGNLVFAYRDYLAPVALALVAVLSAPRPCGGSATADLGCDAFGVLVSLTGQALRVLVIGLAYIKRGGRNKRIAADRLVVEGIFAHVRHPLYVGNFLLLSGLMIVWNSPLGYAVVGLLGFGLFAMARAEEAFLQRKFGAEYAAYCAAVPRFVPRVTGLRGTVAGFTFDWKRVVRKEYGTTFSWTTAALALVALERLRLGGIPRALWPLAGVWAMLAILWAVARWLKKTRRLDD